MRDPCVVMHVAVHVIAMMHVIGVHVNMIVNVTMDVHVILRAVHVFVRVFVTFPACMKDKGVIKVWFTASVIYRVQWYLYARVQAGEVYNRNALHSGEPSSCYDAADPLVPEAACVQHCTPRVLLS